MPISRKKRHLLFLGSLLFFAAQFGCRGERKQPQVQDRVEDSREDPPFALEQKAVHSGAASTVAPVLIECGLQGGDFEVYLDEAGRLYDAGEFERALACAEEVLELTVRSIGAQHIRAAALAALGRSQEAQLAFSLALSLEPNDPETLVAAADFYVNILEPKRRDSLLLGLEYARRGVNNVGTDSHYERSLRARLFLRVAEALNDLGAAKLALPKVEEALVLAPELVDAEHERGVSLFHLSRFGEALDAFLAVLTVNPDDAFAHYHLGLLYERFGGKADSEAHLQRAFALAPEAFGSRIKVSRAEFDAEVAVAVESLSDRQRALLATVSFQLVDFPDKHDLLAAEPPFSPTILGLFRGVPLAAAGAGPTRTDRVSEPSERSADRAILLYRNNIMRAAHSRADLAEQIRRTLIHELGHVEGLDEAQLRRLGFE